MTSTPTGGSSSYTYDASGNTTLRDLPGTTRDQNLVWTPENKLDKITSEPGDTTTYVYDAEGNRILENSAAGSTLYLGETELTTGASGTITRASRSYAQPGVPTVTRTTTNGATTGHKRSVMIADKVGTANTAVEVHSGQAVTRRFFKPYGEVRGTKPQQWPDTRSYLGVDIDDEATGLTHIGAREYDQNTGRFISADPLLDVSDPLQMNGYAYSNNSPISRSDPTGLMNAMDPSSGNATQKEIVELSYELARARGQNNRKAMQTALATWDSLRPPSMRHFETVLPRLVVDRRMPGADKFINAIRKDAYERNLWYTLPDPDVLPSYFSELASFQARACHETKVCPGGKAYLVGKALAGAAVSGRSMGRKGLPESSGDICVSNSFVGGTRVLMADGSPKAIEDVKVGEKVLATDPETGKTAAKEVTAEILGKDSMNLVKVTLDSGGDSAISVTATDGHPFWVPELREWVDATDLKPGQWLRTSSGTHVLIKAVKRWTQQSTVYNLTVDEIHTYYVLAGATPVLVHNCDWASYGDDSAHAHYDKHALGMDDDGNLTRTPDMPGYDTADGFDRYVADSKSLMCSESCPAGVREGTRTDGTLIRLATDGKLGMLRGGKIVSFFRPDDPTAYFETEIAR